MPTNTPNLDLEKPLGSEKYDIAKLNANFDKIDSNALNKLTYKGEVALLADLPSTNQKIGDYYIVIEKGIPYLWNGTEFKPQVVIPEVEVSAQSIGALISSADAKAIPHDNDAFGYSDSQDVTKPNILKKLTWLNFKNELKIYFDTLYATITNLNLKAPITNPTFIGTQTLPNIVTNGVKFPATQVPSSDPNTLDDYEKGTWTPTVSSLDGGSITSYTVNNANYVKIGKLVFLNVKITITNKGTGTGHIYVSLPFTAIPSGSGSGRINNNGQTLSIGIGTTTFYASSYVGMSTPIIDNFEYMFSLFYQVA